MEMIHIMTKHPESIHPDDMLAKAKEMMDVAEFRRLPVVKDDQVVGMLTERNLRACCSTRPAACRSSIAANWLESSRLSIC